MYCSTKMKIAAAVIVLGVVSSAIPAGAASTMVIYSDSLQNGWQPWGWATVNYNNAKPVHSGGKSIAITVKKGFDALYVHHSAFSTAGYSTLTFWVNGGASGGQQLQIQATAEKKAIKAFRLPRTLPAHRWVKEAVKLSDLGAANRKDIDGFWIQDGSGKPLPTFFVDDIAVSK